MTSDNTPSATPASLHIIMTFATVELSQNHMIQEQPVQLSKQSHQFARRDLYHSHLPFSSLINLKRVHTRRITSAAIVSPAIHRYLPLTYYIVVIFQGQDTLSTKFRPPKTKNVIFMVNLNHCQYILEFQINNVIYGGAHVVSYRHCL